MLTTMLTLLGLAAALTSAQPTTEPSTKQATLQLFAADNCNGPATPMTVFADKCYNFAPGIKSLRVVGHDDGIRYNALNVYAAVDCASGPVLQPILTDACSAVVMYSAIKLSIETPRD